jgi:hypothetical protein
VGGGAGVLLLPLALVVAADLGILVDDSLECCGECRVNEGLGRTRCSGQLREIDSGVELSVGLAAALGVVSLLFGPLVEVVGELVLLVVAVVVVAVVVVVGSGDEIVVVAPGADPLESHGSEPDRRL